MAEFIVVHSVKVATDFTPETFGRLTTIGPRFRLRDANTKKYVTFQVYQCACGNIKLMPIGNVGRTSFSCGCLRNERVRDVCGTHGKQNTPEYRIWNKMRSRCYSKNNNMYRYYGERGISVCDRWQGRDGFLNFLADVGPRPSMRHSIDRIDNDGNYEPGNVRWATGIEQANNKSNNRWLVVNGERDTLANWSRRAGICVATIKNRLKIGWSETDAVTVPSQKDKDRYTLTLGDRTQTLAQWSAETGLSVPTIRRRMALKMPVESVLQTSNHAPGKRRKEHTTYTNAGRSSRITQQKPGKET